MLDRLLVLSQYQTVLWFENIYMNVRLLTLIYCGTCNWPNSDPAKIILIYRHSIQDHLSEPQKLCRFFVTFQIKNFYDNSHKLFRNKPVSCINMLSISFSTIESIFTAINDKVSTLAHKKISSGFLRNYKQCTSVSLV